MNDLNLNSLEAAHVRAINSLVGNIPKLSEDEACEIIDSLTALVFETLRHYLPENDDANNYN